MILIDIRSIHSRIDSVQTHETHYFLLHLNVKNKGLTLTEHLQIIKGDMKSRSCASIKHHYTGFNFHYISFHTDHTQVQQKDI